MRKISIKREQSQAGLSFAERKNRRSAAGGKAKFRPQVKNKLLLLLALLMTAATGAYATDVYVVGNGTGNWLNGVAWDPGAAGNKMTEQNGVYSITFTNVAANPESPFQFKFAINGSWDVNYGCISDTENELNKTLSNIDTSGGNNILFGLTEQADVTISFNLSEMTYMISTKGMKVGDDAAAAPKHLITATYREQTRSLEQPLPYATSIGELFEAVTGEHFSDLISTMSSFEMPLTGISSNNTSVVSIGELNGASTPVTVIADGEATISINFGSYAHGILVSAISPLYANMKSGVKDADKWTASTDGTNFGALPIGGLKGDGSETVTLQYNGRLKVKGVKATSDEKPDAQADPLAVPMTIEAITAGSIKVSNPKAGMQYSLDGGKTKNAVTTDDIVLNVGDKVQFYGNGTSITSYNDTFITSSGDGFTCKVYGNIMSLVDEENFATATTLSENYTFSSLFSEFITLTDASGLLLPATQLTVGCYNSMFYGCTALTAAPALTATQLASGCYQQMFRGCARLTTAPELPATQLAASCYLQMFQGCASLTTAPGLPATQLATACYQQMFMGCTALTASPMLPAETLVTSCYRQMFYQCSKLATVTCLATSGINQSTTNYWLVGAGSQAEDTRTVYTVSTANWPTGNNGIPNNWTRVDVDN